MMKAVSLFSRKKTSRPFKDYYEEWIGTLKNTLIPLLRRSMSSSGESPANLLTTHVEMLHRHFQSYYESLDLAASDDVAQILFPDWRNSLEKPFLWLGDFHPYLFTNLLRSFLNDSDEDDEEEEEDVKIGEVSDLFNKQYEVVMAWKNPTKELMARVEQIECGLRLMVPALAARARKAQIDLVERVGADWGQRKEAAKTAVGDAVAAQMDEMTSVVGDANRLRRSVLADIMSSTSVYQAALFLDGLAQFVVGFRDQQLLSKFERCKLALN